MATFVGLIEEPKKAEPKAEPIEEVKAKEEKPKAKAKTKK